LVSLDWILLGLRVLATVILYAFLGLAFYIIWRDLKQAQGQVTTQFQATDQLPVVATPEKQSLVGGDTLLISIIIPTLNESDHMAVVLDRLVEQAGRFEVVIVDGGQPNNLLSLEGRARLVSTNHAGREAQFNAGAAAAKGDVLLFPMPCWPLNVISTCCPKQSGGIFISNLIGIRFLPNCWPDF
jgi:microcompartment protein CcmK/EutM